jgi:hypothetical protein
MRSVSLFWIVLLLVVGALNGVALADKAAATIEGPASAPKGSEVTLKVMVTLHRVGEGHCKRQRDCAVELHVEPKT